MNKERLKNQKGVTIIALVVTVIVLMILAGVSIGKVVDYRNGTIAKAKDAAQGAKKEMIQEEVILALTKIYAEQDTFDYEVIKRELPKKLKKEVEVTSVGADLIKVTYESQEITVDYNLNIQK